MLRSTGLPGEARSQTGVGEGGSGVGDGRAVGEGLAGGTKVSTAVGEGMTTAAVLLAAGRMVGITGTRVAGLVPGFAGKLHVSLRSGAARWISKQFASFDHRSDLLLILPHF